MGASNVELTYKTREEKIDTAGFASRHMSARLLLLVSLSKQTLVPSCASELGLSQSSVVKDVGWEVTLRIVSVSYVTPPLSLSWLPAALLRNLDSWLRLHAVEFKRKP